MRHTVLALVACMISACATGYVPRISTARGPASAPSVAIDSSWVSQPPDSYGTEHGRMFAVYTNPTVGGTMFFEVVSSEYKSAIEFVHSVCDRTGEAYGMACSPEMRLSPDRLVAEVELATFGGARHGSLVVIPMLGDKSRHLVCTGSWALYGTREDRRLQHDRSVDRLRALCQNYGLR